MTIAWEELTADEQLRTVYEIAQHDDFGEFLLNRRKGADDPQWKACEKLVELGCAQWITGSLKPGISLLRQGPGEQCPDASSDAVGEQHQERTGQAGEQRKD